MATRVVVLGGGFGGLEVSSRLAAALGDRVRITLIDQADAFVFGFSKLDVLFGHRKLDEVRIPYAALAGSGVEFRRERIVAIDPEERRVTTDSGMYDADVLVVALGADLDPSATPGFKDGGTEFYSSAGADAMRSDVESFRGGTAVVGVLGPFFKCPPAPYETAFMLHDHLVARGLREQSDIRIVTSLPMPIPISKQVSEEILSALEERGIHHRPSSKVTRVDSRTKTLQFEDGAELSYDLFLGIPVHKAPAVVVDSGLTEDGWIPVDPATFATRHPGVYAVGDVTSAPVPRAGVIAEGEAATLTQVLIAELTGSPPPPPYAASFVCYMEMGSRLVARVDVSFMSEGGPTALYRPPSVEGAEDKARFRSDRLERWFGIREKAS